ncbi:aconitase family protein [Variovorax sp. Sphag1AA]|uniref:aconitase family protein n=1 Tax=Variovorax sp. Sphag1AA TaxID=2587027 RepID=UPI001614F11C|nr:aconitase family protein [Variovorax sp. Sphag1AA]MBB3182004.1 3-isopropylmalate/(R)-2-methylmalate dehydratase large subunit [Variovorax sp. Sphag1AA]
MEEIRISGRPLFLSGDPELMKRQLEGESLSLREAGPLRDDVSTDEITPVTVMLTHDERLGRYPYVGLEAGGVRPVTMDAVRNGGFGITVAGKRYGKGSSRESSPLAELYAGIRLVIAESFERIYQQNCDNLGLLTSTDFGLLERIAAGESIPIDEFLRGRDPLTQKIIRAGGLLAYSKRLSWSSGDPLRVEGDRPRTLVEKIIAQQAHPATPSVETGEGLFVRCDWRFSHDYFTGMAAHFMHRAFGKPAELHEPASVVAFQDHLVLAAQSVPHVRGGLLPGIRDLTRGHEEFVSLYPVRRHGQLDGEPGAEGICHALMAEQYALPGQVVVGTDSHTPHSGALGCLAFGVGATDIANSWITGYARCKVPETVRVEVSGRLRPGVMAKDVVLHLLRMDSIRSGGAIGAVFEFCGSAVRHMNIDERATLTNMVAELGGFTGIVEPDDKTVDFLRERRSIEFAVEPWMRSDQDARYRTRILIDGSELAPMLASPGDPGNGLPVAELPTSGVPISIAYGGSCTGGKQEDFDRYHEVFQWALGRNRRLPEGVRLYLQFGTSAVRDYCEARGYMRTFEEIGAEIVLPGCGACANCGPGQSLSADDVTISAINRNFPGRSGPGKVWLASPYTVAASAVAGRITSFEQLSGGT